MGRAVVSEKAREGMYKRSNELVMQMYPCYGRFFESEFGLCY